MDNISKFLLSVPELRPRLLVALQAIIEGNTTGMDIKPLHGHKGLFRCRVGKVRIIFERIHGQNFPRDIGFRGDIYKNL